MFFNQKLKQHLGREFTLEDIKNRPWLDLKHIIVLANGGTFKGASLERFSSKATGGNVIREYYTSKNYGKIEEYINNETESLLEVLQQIIRNMPKLGLVSKDD